MASPNIFVCPPQLKTVQHYLKLASDYENREATITYWARLYALQSALKIDRKSPEAKKLLTSLMDWLETFKKENAGNESITNDVAGQAVLENEAFKMFTKADSEDRAANFTKNVVKMFYTAGVLFDVIEVFGDLSEELAAQRKYAKWKATYIHNCLKSGETPIPGPLTTDTESQEEGGGEHGETSFPQGAFGGTPSLGFNHPSVTPGGNQPPETSFHGHDPSHSYAPQNVDHSPQINPANVSQPERLSSPPTATTFTPECYAKAQKYCKYAVSSIDYEDTATAVDYLTKALNLLTTGKES